MTKNKIILSILLTISAESSFAQSNTIKTLKTTAKINNFCSIKANNINFGVVNSPLTEQTASSSLDILCSKAYAYTINLSYGGIYGSGGGSDGVNYTFVKGSGFSGVQIWHAYANGSIIGRFNCYSNNEIYIHTDGQTIANKFGLAVSTTYYDNGRHGLCSGTSVNTTSATKKLSALPLYSYGVMNGLIKKDKLAYAITLPNDSTKVWNKGINSYVDIGTGEYKSIPLNAKIIIAQSSSKYVAADTYLDTVVATISY